MKHKFTARSRMFDIISDDASLLSSVSRFGISLGLGDKTVQEACTVNDIDCNTFLSVINFLTEGNVELQEEYNEVNLETVIGFLKNAHSYFISYKLPLIREKLNDAVPVDEPTDPYKIVLLNFFDEYVDEVKKHMEYEDKTVFPYVLNLLKGELSADYKILDFEDHHTDVDSKIAELKNILIKYHPSNSVNYKLNDVLFDLLGCERDLAMHNMVEDHFFVPVVEVIERKLSKLTN